MSIDIANQRCVKTASDLRAGLDELHRCVSNEDLPGARAAFVRIDVPIRDFCTPVRQARGAVSFLSTVRGRLQESELTRAQWNRLSGHVGHLLVCVEHAFVASLPAVALAGPSVSWLRIPDAIIRKVRFALTLGNSAPTAAGTAVREAVDMLRMQFGTDDERARALLVEATRRATQS